MARESLDPVPPSQKIFDYFLPSVDLTCQLSPTVFSHTKVCHTPHTPHGEIVTNCHPDGIAIDSASFARHTPDGIVATLYAYNRQGVRRILVGRVNAPLPPEVKKILKIYNNNNNNKQICIAP